MKKLLLLTIVAMSLAGCGGKKEASVSNIDEAMINNTIEALTSEYPDAKARIERSVPQVASLWRAEDGTAEEFGQFCKDYFVGDEEQLEQLATTLQLNFESLYGCYNKIGTDLKLRIHVDDGREIEPIDEMFNGFDPSAHLDDDMYENKIAFVVVLNFPSYTLEEKGALCENWSSRDWAYARLGDMFTSRIPASCNQMLAKQLADADNYISNYNIMMGHLLNDKGEHIFPDMALITHWGLRDELKTHYSDGEEGLAKQRMIYQVMKRIIDQSIPQCVINNDAYDWNPYTNMVMKDGKEQKAESEPLTRYKYFLGNFHAMQEQDKYSPVYKTYVERAFSQDMEVSYDEIEKLFTEFCSAPEIKEVAALIEQRMGRKLEPFDIWYDGFKSRSAINEDDLSAKTKALYPNRDAFKAKGMPHILKQIGFSDEMCRFICDNVTVDPSRGAGHALESMMKTDNARLRTRIGKDGMDYKGYNIAVHEFGHNVEQTLTLHNVDYYALRGVPNTAFTEALAFVFQTRDLDFLGIKNDDPNKDAMNTLDIFWGCYEIMGVSLVDMYSWKWLYEHPDATAEQLKDQVIAIAQQVWNQYFEPVLGEKDSPLLAIYSHMIDSPLYLPNYPYGHIIQFQLEQHLKGKNIADEILRIYPVGRLIPQAWMKHAVGSEVSTKPLLEEAHKAAEQLK